MGNAAGRFESSPRSQIVMKDVHEQFRIHRNIGGIHGNRDQVGRAEQALPPGVPDRFRIEPKSGHKFRCFAGHRAQNLRLERPDQLNRPLSAVGGQHVYLEYHRARCVARLETTHLRHRQRRNLRGVRSRVPRSRRAVARHLQRGLKFALPGLEGVNLPAQGRVFGTEPGTGGAGPRVAADCRQHEERCKHHRATRGHQDASGLAAR